MTDPALEERIRKAERDAERARIAAEERLALERERKSQRPTVIDLESIREAADTVRKRMGATTSAPEASSPDTTLA